MVMFLTCLLCAHCVYRCVFEYKLVYAFMPCTFGNHDGVQCTETETIENGYIFRLNHVIWFSVLHYYCQQKVLLYPGTMR